MIPYSRPKLSDLYTLSQSKLLENHTLHSGTYLYSPYMAVPPAPGKKLDQNRTRHIEERCWETSSVTRALFQFFRATHYACHVICHNFFCSLFFARPFVSTPAIYLLTYKITVSHNHLARARIIELFINKISAEASFNIIMFKV